MSERRKLLLADDSVTIQKVVNLTFADEGIDVVAVGDGDAAMEKFIEFAPDLLMVDVNMPGMDGYRICEMIKQDEETAHIPVILLVGSFEPFDEERAYSVGADGYLTKPFQSIRQLVGKVTALLNSDADDFAGETGSNNAAMSAASGAPAQTFQNHDAENNYSEMRGESNSNFGSESDAPVTDYETARFDDADDETIQTNQIGSLPADETQKFSAGFSGEDYEQISADEPFASSFDYEAIEIEEERMETQPLSVEEAGEAAPADSYAYQTAAPRSEDADEFADEGNAAAAGANDADEKFNSAEPVAASVAPTAATPNFSWDFDEMDLLELPRHDDQTSGDEKEETAEIESSEAETVEAEEQTETAPPTETAPSPNFSPEMIEQIAARVVEQLSDRVLQQLTREVVPQVSDLIIKELSAQQENNQKGKN